MIRKKTGGRKAGVPNRTTQEMRDVMQSFIECKIEELDQVYNELEPKDKISAIIKMLPYLLPRQQNIELNATHKQELGHDLSKLSDDELHQLLTLTTKANPNNN